MTKKVYIQKCFSVITKNSNWEIFYRFKEELDKKEGVVFLRGVNTPMHTVYSLVANRKGVGIVEGGGRGAGKIAQNLI